MASATDIVLCLLIRLHSLGGADPRFPPVPGTKPTKQDLASLAVYLHQQIATPSIPASIAKLQSVLKNGVMSPLAAAWVVNTLTAQLRRVRSPDDVAQLLADLKALVTGPESLSDTAQPHLHPSSAFAVFIRRRLVSANRALFSGIARLFDSLRAYVVAGSPSLDAPAPPFAVPTPPEAATPPVPPLAFALEHTASSSPPEADTTSIDVLHRSFDYSSLSSQTALQQGGAQIASLNLAGLLLSQGHITEAATAIFETFGVAQEVGDSQCVLYAMALLARLVTHAGSAAAAEELLRRCHSRAAELGMWRLHALTSVRGGAGDDWLSFDPVTSDLPDGRLALPVEEQSGLQGLQHSLRAKTWYRLGVAALVRTAAKAQLVCHAKSTAPDADAASRCLLARQAVTKFPPRWSAPDAAVVFPEALQWLLRRLQARPSAAMLTEVGVLWQLWSTHRLDIHRAYALERPLDATQSSSCRRATRHASTLLAAGRYDDAYALLSHTLHKLDTMPASDTVTEDRLQCLMCRGALALVSGRHVLAAAAALPDVLHALAINRSTVSEALRQDIIVLLANLLLRLGRVEKARTTMRQLLPTLAEGASASCRAHACLMMAEVQLAGVQAGMSHTGRSHQLDSVLSWLRRSASDWRRLDDVRGVRATAYLEARVHHVRGDVPNRDAASRVFVTAHRASQVRSFTRGPTLPLRLDSLEALVSAVGHCIA